MSKLKFLVTGGAGFIGSNIAERLLQEGHSVRVMDDFSTGKRENISSFAKDIELLEGDIRNFDLVKKAVNSVDVIFHEAALPSVPRSISDPISSNEVNVTGTLNLLFAAKENGVRRFVFASSSSVYGDTPTLPKREDMVPNPLSPYAVTKLTGEKYCKVFSNLYGIETVILRYFNVFGPKQDPNSQYSAVIPKFIKAMLNNESPTIFGDGEQSRDFTYIDNVVEGNILAGTVEKVKGGSVFNCACQGQVTLNELVNSLNNLMNKKINPVYQNERPGDIKHSFADINDITENLNFKPLVNFNTGLKKTIEWYNKQ